MLLATLIIGLTGHTPDALQILRRKDDRISLVSIQLDTGQENPSTRFSATLPAEIERVLLSPDRSQMAVTYGNSGQPLIVIDAVDGHELRRVDLNKGEFIPWAVWQPGGNLDYMVGKLSKDESHVVEQVHRLEIRSGIDSPLGLLNDENRPTSLTRYLDATEEATKAFQRMGFSPPPTESATGGYQSNYFGVYHSGSWGAVSPSERLAIARVHHQSKQSYAVLVGDRLQGTIDLAKDDPVQRVIARKGAIVFLSGDPIGKIEICMIGSLDRILTKGGCALVEEQ